MTRVHNICITVVLSLVSCLAYAHDAKVPASIEHYAFDQVSKHIQVIHGPQELPNPGTRGFMNNPAAVFTQNGIIIIDPGSSLEIGEQLLKKIQAVSDKPVIAVFNTHVHGDHWLGNKAIRKHYPSVPIYAHQRMIERVMAGEGEDWIALLMKMTEGAIEGTEVVAPTIGLKGGENLKFDNLKLRIHHTGHAHTDHDIMIEVINDKVLFFGDVVATKRVPNSDVPHDANFKGTIHAIKSMLELPVDKYIPGHGISGGREIPEASLRFLEELYTSVTRNYKAGKADFEMKEAVINDMHEYQNWNNFNEMGRVISFVYQEVERENF